MRTSVLTLSIVAAALTGCSAMSGIGGSEKFACSAPPGVSCMSVTGVNANVSKGTLPALRSPKSELLEDGADKKAKDKEPSASYDGIPKTAGLSENKRSPKYMDAPYSGQPIRTPPKILRVWMAPFEDTDSDLHDQKYFYVTVHSGKWLVEANQTNIKNQYRQVYPLASKKAGGDDEVNRNQQPLQSRDEQTGPMVQAPVAQNGQGAPAFAGE